MGKRKDERLQQQREAEYREQLKAHQSNIDGGRSQAGRSRFYHHVMGLAAAGAGVAIVLAPSIAPGNHNKEATIDGIAALTAVTGLVLTGNRRSATAERLNELLNFYAPSSEADRAGNKGGFAVTSHVLAFGGATLGTAVVKHVVPFIPETGSANGGTFLVAGIAVGAAALHHIGVHVHDNHLTDQLPATVGQPQQPRMVVEAPGPAAYYQPGNVWVDGQGNHHRQQLPNIQGYRPS